MMGAAALTKKRGGYTNTKLHGIMAWVGMMIAGGGLYVIFIKTRRAWGRIILQHIILGVSEVLYLVCIIEGQYIL